MSRRAFTLIELLVVIAVIALLIGILLPALGRARNAGRLAVSLSNVRQLMVGVAAYRHSERERLPMRLSYNSGGGFGGEDSWSFGGKNTSVYWSDETPGFSGVFDEPAYTRMLNAYVCPDVVIEPPQGYRGFVLQGGQLVFFKGRVTHEERERFQLPVFRSPADRQTQQRYPGGEAPGLSCYDDVGTSYLMNLRWLFAITGGNFVTEPAFREGQRRCQLAEGFDPRFVFITDQTGDTVANSEFNLPAARRRDWMGDYGDKNKSVLGFMDGRAEYLRMAPGEAKGERYSLVFNP